MMELRKPEADRAPVAVAVDGSAYAESAADWAAGEALRRGVPLRVLTVLDGVSGSSLFGAGASAPDWDHRAEAALDLLAETEERVVKANPGLVVERDALVGDPVHELEGAAQQASVLVVGSRGRGGFAGLALGSVSLHLAANARCPLVIVPQGHAAAAHPGPTVVGVHTHDCVQVLRYALEHAERAGGGLRVVHAWQPYPVHSSTYISETDITARQAADLLVEQLKEAQAETSGLRPEIKVLRGQAVKVLVEQSRDADLIVAGSHRRWLPLTGAVGPTLRDLLSQARCPVAVVPVH